MKPEELKPGMYVYISDGTCALLAEVMTTATSDGRIIVKLEQGLFNIPVVRVIAEAPSPKPWWKVFFK